MVKPRTANTQPQVTDQSLIDLLSRQQLQGLQEPVQQYKKPTQANRTLSDYLGAAQQGYESGGDPIQGLLGALKGVAGQEKAYRGQDEAYQGTSDVALQKAYELAKSGDLERAQGMFGEAQMKSEQEAGAAGQSRASESARQKAISDLLESERGRGIERDKMATDIKKERVSQASESKRDLQRQVVDLTKEYMGKPHFMPAADAKRIATAQVMGGAVAKTRRGGAFWGQTVIDKGADTQSARVGK
jgi:hypothetical protein